MAAELAATHQHPKAQTKFVKRVAKKLKAILACYLAGEVASVLSPMAAIEHREIVAPMYDSGRTLGLKLPEHLMGW